MDYKGHKLYLQNKDGKFEEFTYEMAIKEIQSMQRTIDYLLEQVEEKYMEKYPFIVENGIICKKNIQIDMLLGKLNKIYKLNKKILNSKKEKIELDKGLIDVGYVTPLIETINEIIEEGGDDNETNNN